VRRSPSRYRCPEVGAGVCPIAVADRLSASVDPAQVGRLDLHEVGRARVDERLHVLEGVTPLVGYDIDVDVGSVEPLAELDHGIDLVGPVADVHRPLDLNRVGAAASSSAAK